MTPDKTTTCGKDLASLFKLYKIIAGLFIASVAILGVAVFSTAFESDSRYFSPSIAVLALNMLVIPAAILAVCAILTFRGQSIIKSENIPSRIATLFTAVFATVPFIYYIYMRSVPAEADQATFNYADRFYLPLAITALAVAAFSILCLFKANRSFTLTMGFGQVFFCILIIAKFYLDYTVELNSPIKLLLQFSAAAVMLGTIADIRGIINKQNSPLFIISKLLSATIPILYFVACLAEIAPNLQKYNHDYVILAPLFLFYGITSAARLLSIRTVYLDAFEPIADIGSDEAETEKQNEAEPE